MKYLIPLFFLFNCSAEYHIQKAIKKDPSILQVDTVKVIDTVQTITEHVEHDTVFDLRTTTDTITIQKDRLTIKHYYSRDSVYLWGECQSDTIIQVREIQVPVEKVVYHESFDWWKILIFVIVAVGVLLLIQFFRR